MLGLPNMFIGKVPILKRLNKEEKLYDYLNNLNALGSGYNFNSNRRDKIAEEKSRTKKRCIF